MPALTFTGKSSSAVSSTLGGPLLLLLLLPRRRWRATIYTKNRPACSCEKGKLVYSGRPPGEARNAAVRGSDSYKYISFIRVVIAAPPLVHSSSRPIRHSTFPCSWLVRICISCCTAALAIIHNILRLAEEHIFLKYHLKGDDKTGKTEDLRLNIDNVQRGTCIILNFVTKYMYY